MKCLIVVLAEKKKKNQTPFLMQTGYFMFYSPQSFQNMPFLSIYFILRMYAVVRVLWKCLHELFRCKIRKEKKKRSGEGRKRRGKAKRRVIIHQTTSLVASFPSPLYCSSHLQSQSFTYKMHVATSTGRKQGLGCTKFTDWHLLCQWSSLPPL